MKFAVFAPAARESAIGRVAALVCNALQAEDHECVVIRTENSRSRSGSTHDFGAEIIWWHDKYAVKSALRKADVAVHHVGNNYEFHRGSLAWLPRQSGVVCLHDFYLAGLFWAWSANRREEATKILTSWYGGKVARAFFEHEGADRFIAGTHAVAPMTEWLSASAAAVITHSSWGVQRVLRACAGPVRVVPLPYTVRQPTLGCSNPTISSNGKTVLLTFGHINRNKRVDSVILAIGSSRTLREHLHYRLVGPIEPNIAEELTLLAKSAGVELEIRGSVSDEELYNEIQHAQVISCLRLPALEAASASAIEAMMHGKPMIVTDTGFYRDIPDDCARKIDPENEWRDVQTALECLLIDPAARVAMGQRAKSWAQQTFVASNYAREMIEISRDVLATRPIQCMLSKIVGVSARWIDDTSVMLNSTTLGPLNIFE